MSDKEIVFRLWEDADEEQMRALIRQHYGDIETSHGDFFDWEYRRSPWGRAIICCGKLTDGTVVSSVGALPTPVFFEGIATTGSVAVNALTHPDFRGQGLFPGCGRMMCEALKQAGIALTYGFPNPVSYAGWTRRVGFADIGRARLLIRPHDPARLLSARFPAARSFKLAGLARVLVRGLLKTPRRSVTVKVRSSFDGLPMAHLREDTRLVLDSNIEWLTWRYVDVPRREYHVAVAGGAQPSGMAVYRITSLDWRRYHRGPRPEEAGSETDTHPVRRHEEMRIALVSDLFLAKDCSLDVVESLMHHVFSEAEASGCAATFCLVSPRSRKLKMLKRAGFWVVPSTFEPQPFPVTIRGHTVPVSDITVADMEVSFGVYDIL